MTRRVRRRTTKDAAHQQPPLDWTALPDDATLHFFARLSYRDRAALAATCRAWRSLAASPCLWAALDLRRLDPPAAASLAPRCSPHLRRLRLAGCAAADAAPFLRATNLRSLRLSACRDLTDAALAVLAARHARLEELHVGAPDPLDRVSCDALRHVALCCPRLRCLRLSGLREVGAGALAALARHCPLLHDLAFLDCLVLDETALAGLVSLRFLSVAGCSGVKWATASEAWAQLPSLSALDVSRTDVSPGAVSRLVSHSATLTLICALNCPSLEEEEARSPAAFANSKGKLVLTINATLSQSIAAAALFPHTTAVKPTELFDDDCHWSGGVPQLMTWLEWVLSQSFLRIAETNPHGMNQFWLDQGTALLLSLLKSSQEDVQERAATTLAAFAVVDDQNANVDPARSEAVMREGGIPMLLDLARRSRETLQSEAAKAIANLSVNPKVAKAVADQGGITILTNMAKSANRLVAEEAAGGLWNLSVGEEHKVAIEVAGGIKILVDLIFRWPAGTGVLERAAGALANLAADDKCSLEVAMAGGIHALVTLARSCKVEGVLEQAARALANLAAHGENNNNNAAVGQEPGALEALVQLTRSPNEGVRQEAAGALWNLSFDDRNRESIATAGGVEALVSLCQECLNASNGLQERAAGALWGLSVSQANSIAIGREGGVVPLIALAQSEVEEVHETAAGALWNLAFYSCNSLRIVENGGVPVLVNLCSSSGSKMARFMAALTLAYMFDGRMDEVALVGTSSQGSSKIVNFERARRLALKHIEAFVLTFSDPQMFSMAASSSGAAALSQVAEVLCIPEAGHLRCSAAEIARLIDTLRNPSSVLRACAAFALLQFTIPGGRHALHHVDLLQKAGASRVLRWAAAAATAPIEAKIFARIVLRNLELHQAGPST
ncbi:hypothetical protein QYE76_071886 [Lolium multiflorum]|uniref:F-box domain-containing protein n=1 Tax=Lolium multiflorum TaxID=4521 RepID=A0AAD8SKW4_LOLMU|nr:hypothetical protein QYE76_071886 [Lolium multiflorum]